MDPLSFSSLAHPPSRCSLTTSSEVEGPRMFYSFVRFGFNEKGKEVEDPGLEGEDG